MNTAVNNTIAQYVSLFIENIATKFNVSQDELNDLWKDTQKTKFKVKPTRRVNANKKPSAYINFCSQQRKILKEQKPELTFGEVAKELGGLWKSLSDAEKKKYLVVEATTTEVAVAEPETEPETEKKVKKTRKNKN